MNIHIRGFISKIYVFPETVFGAQEAADFAKIGDFGQNGHFWLRPQKWPFWGGPKNPPKSPPIDHSLVQPETVFVPKTQEGRDPPKKKLQKSPIFRIFGQNRDFGHFWPFLGIFAIFGVFGCFRWWGLWFQCTRYNALINSLTTCWVVYNFINTSLTT